MEFQRPVGDLSTARRRSFCAKPTLSSPIHRAVHRLRRTKLARHLLRRLQGASELPTVSRVILRVFGIGAIVGRPPLWRRDRGRSHPEPNRVHRYSEAALTSNPDTFALYRVIGNDIVPRHRKGQSRANLDFLLRNEPDIPSCEKWWIVNRIVDSAEEAAILQLLDSHQQRYIHLPFRAHEYARLPFDLRGMPFPGFTLSNTFRDLPEPYTARLFQRLYSYKNNYVMNNNGARNAALESGRTRAKWVLPWDGNCYVSSSAWADIREAVRRNPSLPYFVVPMIRTTTTAEVLAKSRPPTVASEPQIVFRCDAGEKFDENFYYGRRPKVELLWRLGVPGPWDEWAAEPWDLPVPDFSPDAGLFQEAGWVFRLPSGVRTLEIGRASATRRQSVRAGAVSRFLATLDGNMAREHFSRSTEGVAHQELPQRARRDSTLVLIIAMDRIGHVIDRPRQRRSRNAGRFARDFLLANYKLPWVLGVDREVADSRSLVRLYRWLSRDAGARAARRSLGLEGGVYDALWCALALRLGRFAELARYFVYVCDRAQTIFGSCQSSLNPLRDQRSRCVWQCLDSIADACGVDIWIGANRPEILGRADCPESL